MTVVESFLIIPRLGCRPYGRNLQGTTGFSSGTPYQLGLNFLVNYVCE